MRAYLDQLLSEGEQPVYFVVVLEEVGDGDLQKGELVGENLEIASAAAVGEECFVVSKRKRLLRLKRMGVKLLGRKGQLRKLFSRVNELPEFLEAKVFAQKVQIHTDLLLDFHLQVAFVVLNQLFEANRIAP